MNVIVSETALTLVEGKVLCGIILRGRDGKEYPLSIGEPVVPVIKGIFTIFNVFTWEQLKGTYCVIEVDEDNQIISVQDILGVHPPIALNPPKSEEVSNTPEDTLLPN